jgi:hypothetical protein
MDTVMTATPVLAPVIPNPTAMAIHKTYHNNWILDDLAEASKIEDDKKVTPRYRQGFPIGFISYNSGKAYIYNHVNIEIMYQ